MSTGWIKLHRQSIDNGWLKNHKLWVFWTYCLLKASHDRQKVIIGYQEIILEPGQFIFGRKKAAKDLKMSEREIRTCMHFLKKCQNVTIKPTNKFSIVTICNWETYQGDLPSQEASKTANNGPTSDQQVTTYKNVKNVKNIKEKDFVANATPTPADITRTFFAMFYDKNLRNGTFSDYAKYFETKELCQDFCDYWTEKTKNGKKEKWELQKTFELKKRIATWNKNREKWGK